MTKTFAGVAGDGKATRASGVPGDTTSADSDSSHGVKKSRSRGERRHMKQAAAAPATCDETVDTSDTHALRLLEAIAFGDLGDASGVGATEKAETPEKLDGPVKLVTDADQDDQPSKDKVAALPDTALDAPQETNETRSPTTPTSTLVRRQTTTGSSPPTSPDVAVAKGYESKTTTISEDSLDSDSVSEAILADEGTYFPLPNSSN